MLYSPKVIQHFKNPHNQGNIPNADAVGQEGNPACGDVMKIYLKVEKEKIKDIKFETFGCAAAIAVTSVLTDLAKGKTLKEAKKISKDDIVKELGGLPPAKIHCSMLGIDALKRAINNYYQNYGTQPKRIRAKN
ncbi:iron-sulfur cluster assembly scaffold protein [Candidatus Parcubacteria bacterium]|nr:MAG: iron-sulfur cluster assembly scaffold protein [Candidatus Parcubacteria bacterium]